MNQETMIKIRIAYIFVLHFLFIQDAKPTNLNNYANFSMFVKNMDTIIQIEFQENNVKLPLRVMSEESFELKKVELGQLSKNTELSKMLNKEVYSAGDKIIVREQRGSVYYFLYQSKNDLIQIKMRTFIMLDGMNVAVVVKNDKTQTEAIMTKKSCNEIAELKDSKRKAYKLDNLILVTENRTKESFVYNSIDDLRIYNPFESQLNEVKVIENNQRLIYIEQGLNIPVTLVRHQGQKTSNSKSISNISVLKNGKISYDFYEGVSLVFESKTDFETFESKRKTYTNRDKYVFQSVMDNPGEFINNKLVLAQQLSKDLGLSNEKLDYSIASIRVVEDELNKYFLDDFHLEKIYPSLIAYIGECIIKEKGGSWVFNSESNQNNVEKHLFIKTESGKIIDFLPNLWDELYNQKETGHCSIASFLVPILQMR